MKSARGEKDREGGEAKLKSLGSELSPLMFSLNNFREAEQSSACGGSTLGAWKHHLFRPKISPRHRESVTYTLTRNPF